jgi:sec-independent protein translocase protein TatC
MEQFLKDIRGKNLVQNIINFRRSLLRIAVASGILTLINLFYTEQIIKLVGQSITTVPLVFYSPGEAFISYIKVAFLSSLFLISPLIFYYFWQGIAPFFMQDGQTYALPVVMSAVVLFLTGCILCYFFVLPYGIQFLVSYGTSQIDPYLSIDSYVSFVFWLTFAFGMIFELPLIMLLLGRVGLIQASHLTWGRRYAFLIIAITSAILTPTPDIFNMCLMMAPLMVLYEVSVILVKLFGKK